MLQCGQIPIIQSKLQLSALLLPSIKEYPNMKFNKPISTIRKEIKADDINSFMAENLKRFGFDVTKDAPSTAADTTSSIHPDHPHTPKK